MPPLFLDLDLEPWSSAEQEMAPGSAPRTFQQDEAGPNMQRTPSKRKHPDVDSSPPELLSSKRHKSLSETELGIIKLAAGILEIPLASLLAARSETHARSEGSSITYDSHEAPSTGPEQTDGFDISVEPPGRRQQPAPTSAPAFPSPAAFNGNANVGYSEPHAFRGDLNINSKNHLEWWSVNGGMVFNDFEPPTTAPPPTNPQIRQDPISQPDEWGHPRFEDTILPSEPGAGGQPAWGSAPQGLPDGYHGIPPQGFPADQLQHSGPAALQLPQLHRQMFGPIPYGARSRQEARISDMSPAFMEMDYNGDTSEIAFGGHDVRPPNQARVTESSKQTSALKPPRQRRNHRNGDGRRPGRRGPLTEEQRLETSLTRRQGACIRCQWQAIKCERDPLDPDGCCLTCRKVDGQTMTRLPCLRYKINDAQLVDKASHPKYIWSRRWDSMKIVEIEDWRSSEIKTIVLTQDVGGVANATYELQVREFVPVEGDSLFRGWKTNGVEKKHACTPYAIANMVQTGLQLVAFADKHIGTFIKFYIDKTDKLMWNTYYMAYKHSQSVPRKEERDLLRNALKLWVGSRMESRRERICSTEVLNMQPQEWDLEADNYGAYLIPPVLQAQIELLTTACVLLPMKRDVLKGLQKLMKANQTKSWFTIYLCMFLLMHNCALLTQAENLRARREPRVSDLHPQARYYNPGLVKELHVGANILLAHFHYCNKGSHPFSMDWRNTDSSSIAFAELGPEEKLYMQQATDEVRRRAHLFKDIKETKKFEDDYYFLSQLYEYNWTPTHTV